MTRKSLLSTLAMDLAGVIAFSSGAYRISYMDVGVNMDIKNHCLGQGFGRGNLLYKNQGVTLIELLIMLAVTSILLANALPNFSALIAQERSIILTNTLAGAFAYARTEAITKQTIITSCQSDNGRECNRSKNWHNGWIIFSDKNNNKQRDPEETLLRVYNAFNNGTKATYEGAFNRDHYLQYKPTGRAYPNGSFFICNPAIGIGKALTMHQTGRLRLSKTDTDGNAVIC